MAHSRRRSFYLCSQVVKMQNMITYPLYDLDMTEHVPFPDPDTCYMYDLFGVVVSELTIKQDKRAWQIYLYRTTSAR